MGIERLHRGVNVRVEFEHHAARNVAVNEDGSGGEEMLVQLMRITVVIIALGIPDCSGMTIEQDGIVIGLTNDAAWIILQPQQPNPVNTGISSLDALNQKWQVQRMTPVFPDVSPDDAAGLRAGLAGVYKLSVPRGTNLRAMIQEYQSDPHVVYAEISTRVEMK